MTAKQERVLQAVLSCRTRRDAAKVAGVCEKTIQNYFALEEFKQAYNAALNELVQDATQRAKIALAPAIGVLQGISSDTQETATSRIAASRALLEYGLKLIEINDVLQRLNALEKRLTH